MTVVIYGASDDLIEVEGDANEEFSTDGAGGVSVLVVGGHGEIVKVTPLLGAWWSAHAQIIAPGPRGHEVSVAQVARPGREPGGDMGVQVNMAPPLRVFKVVNE